MLGRAPAWWPPPPATSPAQAPPGRFRLLLPADTFAHPAASLDGVPVQTVSPLALYQLRATSALTRSVGEKREWDQAMQARLKQAFFASSPDWELRPEIVGL